MAITAPANPVTVNSSLGLDTAGGKSAAEEIQAQAEEIQSQNEELRVSNQAILEASEASHRLAAIVDSSEDAIIGKTLDGVITSWNKGAERLYGYTADEVIARPISVLLPADHHDELPGILERVARGELVEPYESVRTRKDGTPLDVSLSVSPVKDGAGRIVGASTIARDITQRMRAEREIEQLNADLQQRATALAAVNRELEAFSYSVSHDLRAPLRSIDGFSQALLEDYQDKPLDKKGKHFLQRLRIASQQMAQL